MSKYQLRIAVTPRYAPEHSAPDAGQYSFYYTISITNTGQVAAQLIARHWLIEDTHGHTEEVKGLGVVGHQPLLSPGECFEYTSGCELKTAQGMMHGSYFFVAEDGERFDVPIAPFLLNAGSTGHGSLH